jgi:predicted dehydrogenase
VAHSRKQVVVVGAGLIGAVHAAAIRAAGGTVRGVIGSTPERSAALARAWETSVSYPGLTAALARRRRGRGAPVYPERLARRAG